VTSITRKTLFRLHCFGWAFTPKLLPTLGFIVLLPLLLKLGFWQLDRAEFKQHIQAQYQSSSQAAPLPLSQLNTKNIEALDYSPISLTGHYDNAHQFLLDNRVRHRRVGYDVLTPFIPSQGNKIILVNRGWIPSTGDRKQLPRIKQVNGTQHIKGLIKLPMKKFFTLSQHTISQTWPRLTQNLNLKKISASYQRPLYPFIVLLSPEAPHGYIREWKPTAMPPKKHWGYAVQWFALAGTLVIMYLALNLKKQRGRYESTRKN